MNDWIKVPINQPQAAHLFNLIKDTGAFIAGSYPLSLISEFPANDIDIFTGNWDTFYAVDKAFQKAGLRLICESTITVEYTDMDLQKITIIKPIDNDYAEELYGSTKVAGTKEEILDSFDLHLSEAVLEDENTVLISRDCKTDLELKQIRFKSLAKPRRALIRAFKYAKKGFGIGDHTIDFLLKAIRSVTEPTPI